MITRVGENCQKKTIDGLLRIVEETHPMMVQRLREEFSKLCASQETTERLCRAVAACGVTFEDEKMGFVEIQLDRRTWDEIVRHCEQQSPGGKHGDLSTAG